MSTSPKNKISINLVLHEFNRGWVIEKMALRLCSALKQLGVEAEVSAVTSPHATINHFMMFQYVEPQPGTINTMAVTHVDDALKIDMVRKYLAGGIQAAICMSTMTVNQLAGYGIDPKQLVCALPAHDCVMVPRRIVVGITSANYGDGRKRDWLLRRLSEVMTLTEFEFRIFGHGWEEISDCLVAAGARVVLKKPSDDYRSDYDEIKAAVPNFDYYFYSGLDEGSLGTLDALSAGVKTIVTNQGFHLDIPNGITHGFWTFEELKEIFEDIARERGGRIQPVQSLTWSRYASRHLDIWSSLIERKMLPPADNLGAKIKPLESRYYPVKGYTSLLRNRFRRDMCLRFWVPEPYKKYLDVRGRLRSALRRLKIKAR